MIDLRLVLFTRFSFSSVVNERGVQSAMDELTFPYSAVPAHSRRHWPATSMTVCVRISIAAAILGMLARTHWRSRPLYAPARSSLSALRRRAAFAYEMYLNIAVAFRWQKTIVPTRCQRPPQILSFNADTGRGPRAALVLATKDQLSCIWDNFLMLS